MERKLRDIDNFIAISVLFAPGDDLARFLQTLQINQKSFQRNGIELVVVAAGECKEILDLPDKYPFINWKIIFIDSIEQTKSELLTIGLGYASQRFILLMDTSVCLSTDWIKRLRYAQHDYPGSYSVIPVSYHAPDLRNTQENSLLAEPYYLMMIERRALMSAGGFFEFNDPALNDTSLQRRLEMAGYRPFRLPAEIELTAGHDNVEPVRLASTNKEAFYPTRLIPLQTLQLDGSASFDWQKDKSSMAAVEVLSNFKQVWRKSADCLERRYQLIALIQVRNEIHHIPDVLLHLDGICDGIVLLDDDSTDGSYEKALSEKLLLKVQKQYDGIFDDLANRNLLLQLSYLVKAEWFFIIDADERFHSRQTDLRTICLMEDVDTIIFRRVHLWNTEDQYRKDVPEGIKGVMHRPRMFRNKGFLQLQANKEIHFSPIPLRQNKFRSSVLLLHYGMLDQTSRIKKNSFYNQQDPDGIKQGFTYDFLLDDQIELGNVKDLLK